MTGTVVQPAEITALAPPNFGLTKFLDVLPIPQVIRPHLWWQREEITVDMVDARVRLHSQLPLTDIWSYSGQFPGPTIEVRSGKTLRVHWVNNISKKMPLVAVVGPLADAPNIKPAGYRDASGNLLPGYSVIEGVTDLPAWNVVHLHGALTNAGQDGWAHNAVLKGFSQLTEYPNRQQSTTMWYHDHAMAVTRFNVQAGLAGMYLIRDAEEDALHLPQGKYEVPLVFCDRNLDTDPATGALTGQLLYKLAGPDEQSGTDVREGREALRRHEHVLHQPRPVVDLESDQSRRTDPPDPYSPESVPGPDPQAISAQRRQCGGLRPDRRHDRAAGGTARRPFGREVRRGLEGHLPGTAGEWVAVAGLFARKPFVAIEGICFDVMTGYRDGDGL